MLSVENLFEAVNHSMTATHEDVEVGKIFHSSGLKCRGKFFAFVRKGDLVVKLPAQRVDELIATEGGVRFEAGQGRAMKEWVVLCPVDVASCASYVHEAFDFLRGTED